MNRHTCPARKRRCAKIALVGFLVGIVGGLLLRHAGQVFSTGVFLVSASAMLLVAALVNLRDWRDEDD